MSWSTQNRIASIQKELQELEKKKIEELLSVDNIQVGKCIVIRSMRDDKMFLYKDYVDISVDKILEIRDDPYHEDDKLVYLEAMWLKNGSWDSIEAGISHRMTWRSHLLGDVYQSFPNESYDDLKKLIFWHLGFNKQHSPNEVKHE